MNAAVPGPNAFENGPLQDSESHNASMRFAIIVSLILHAAIIGYGWHQFEPAQLHRPRSSIAVQLSASTQAPGDPSAAPETQSPESSALRASQNESTVVPEPPEAVKELVPKEGVMPDVDSPTATPAVANRQTGATSSKPAPATQREPVREPVEVVRPTESVANPSHSTSAPETREAAPDPTTARTDSAEVERRYIADLHAHVARFQRYPARAARRGLEGRVELEFSVLTAGGLSDARIVQGSGQSLLDQAAVNALQDAQPLPKPPDEFRAPYRFRVGLVYRAER